MADATKTDDGCLHYLSVFMAPPDDTALANIRHDHCAALWRDDGTEVSIVRYWEFERISGFKHHRIPIRDLGAARSFLDSLLADEGFALDELDAVWGTPWLETDDSYAAIADEVNLPLHSLSHLFAAVLGDWERFRNDTIVGMALDLAPDWTLDSARCEMAYAGCVVEGGHLSTFPVESPGPYWFCARDRFGLEEGTLMALASATTCTAPAGEELVSLLVDIELWDPALCVGDTRAALGAVIDVVESDLSTRNGRRQYGFDDRFSQDDNLRSAVMKIVDTASTAIAERNLARIRRDFEVDFSQCWLALGGGYTLNCPNNTRILDTYRFKGLLAPPAVDDGGQALGIGLMALHANGAPQRRDFRLPGAYLGRTELGLDTALQTFEPFIKSVEERDLDRLIDDIAAGPVAWVEGAAEIGPRALGHRSILGDPTKASTKDVLNTVKQRQWWRPVAPMVLEEETSRWFETERPSPFMLEAVVCRAEMRDQIPAALHLDGTARIQTVSRRDEPLMYDVIHRQYRRSGVPMLCNTSLNDKGEPIVDDAEQALNFCIRKGIAVVYIGDRRVELRPAAEETLDGRSERRRAVFMELVDRWPDVWREVTERGLPVEGVFLAAWSPELRARMFAAVGDDRRQRLFGRFVQHLVDAMPADQRRVVDGFVAAFGPDGDPTTQGYDLDVIV